MDNAEVKHFPILRGKECISTWKHYVRLQYKLHRVGVKLDKYSECHRHGERGSFYFTVNCTCEG